MVPKIYLCPSDKKYTCSWEGSSDDILQHFSEEHEDLLSFSNSVSLDLRTSSENKLIFYEEEIYLLQFKIVEDHLFIVLRYLGPSKIASQITFDIDIQSSNAKLDRGFITVRSGYFGISLEKINETFKEENELDCILSVSGDFKSVVSFEHDETENVEEKSENSEKLDVLEDNKDENWKRKPVSIDIEPSYGNIQEVDSSHLADDVFDKSPDSGISMTCELNQVLPKYGRLNSYAEGNSIFYDDIESPTKDSSVTRSQSLNDECRRKTVIRKTTSVHSLGSIKEDDLDFELHCVNCENLLYSPIFGCLSGHSFCPNCAVNSEFCAICAERINGERNWVLEEKAQKHFYFCRNNKNGCSVKLPYNEILKHHIGCKFCMYNCPITGCGQMGIFKTMYQHMKLIHGTTKIFESFIATFQKQNDAFLLSEDKGIFYCRVLNNPESVVWEATFCGPNERKFFCELKFKERNLKAPIFLRQTTSGGCYRIELNHQELKKFKVKSKNAILTITSFIR